MKEKELTSKQFEQLAKKGIHPTKAVFLEELKLLKITRQENETVCYHTSTPNSLATTDWLTNITSEEIALGYLKLTDVGKATTYYSPDLSEHTAWLKNVVSEEIIHGCLKITNSEREIVYYTSDLSKCTPWLEGVISEKVVNQNLEITHQATTKTTLPTQVEN